MKIKILLIGLLTVVFSIVNFSCTQSSKADDSYTPLAPSFNDNYNFKIITSWIASSESNWGSNNLTLRVYIIRINDKDYIYNIATNYSGSAISISTQLLN
jgi:hypothetical protein